MKHDERIIFQVQIFINISRLAWRWNKTSGFWLYNCSVSQTAAVNYDNQEAEESLKNREIKTMIIYYSLSKT
jgi:hypothetical protein